MDQLQNSKTTRILTTSLSSKEASDSEGDFDMRDYDDDGQRLVDESGEELIPFDPTEEYDENTA
eukprot:996041-Karenia_brevis.AAC.1